MINGERKTPGHCKFSVPVSSVVSVTSPSPLLSTKLAMRSLGSQASSGVTHHDIRANTVTMAIMIGASEGISISIATGLRLRGRTIRNVQFKVAPVTGNSYGEKRIATHQPFQNIPINWKGLLQRPRLHLGLG